MRWWWNVFYRPVKLNEHVSVSQKGHGITAVRIRKMTIQVYTGFYRCKIWVLQTKCNLNPNPILIVDKNMAVAKYNSFDHSQCSCIYLTNSMPLTWSTKWKTFAYFYIHIIHSYNVSSQYSRQHKLMGLSQ